MTDQSNPSVAFLESENTERFNNLNPSQTLSFNTTYLQPPPNISTGLDHEIILSEFYLDNNTLNIDPEQNIQTSDRHEPNYFLEQFELREILGEGGMGVVFNAFQSDLDRFVAIKSLKIQRVEADEQLINEARLMAKLSHPNIPPIHSYSRVEVSTPYVVMKKIEGKTFKEWLGGGPARG